MKATVHSVLFLCALCVLIWGGVSIAAQGKELVVEKATATRKTVNDAKGLAEKVKEANEDFTKNITDLGTLSSQVIKGVHTALSNAGRIAAGTPNKFFAFKNITDMNAKVTEAQDAVAKLRAAVAASLKDSKKAEIDNKLKAVEKEIISAENAANAMTDDDASITGVVQEAEKLEKAAQEAVAFWTKVENSVRPQKNVADTAIAKIETAITEVAKSIEYVGENRDANAVDAKNALENDVSAKLTTQLATARAIQTASVGAHTNARTLAEKYRTVITQAGELEQAAKDSKPDGALSFSTGPLLSFSFSVIFLCLCVLPLQW